MGDGLTDSELMERSVAHPDNFAELFDRYHGGLYRYLRRRAGPSLAADIAAETFHDVFHRHVVEPGPEQLAAIEPDTRQFPTGPLQRGHVAASELVRIRS